VPDVAFVGSLELGTFGSDVTGDATVTTGELASFVLMLFDSLCRIKASILTNNNFLTLYVSYAEGHS